METYHLYNTSFSWARLNPGDILYIHTWRQFSDLVTNKTVTIVPPDGTGIQTVIIAVQNRETQYGWGLFITLLTSEKNNPRLITFRKAAVR